MTEPDRHAEVSADLAFAILRWRPDPTRDEARNVAVILADSTGTRGGLLAAPLASLQLSGGAAGLLDAVVHGLDVQFKAELKPTLQDLFALRSRLTESIYLTEPQVVVAADPDAVLRALYEAYVAPRPLVSASSKAALIDQTVAIFRMNAFELSRGAYVGDFVFDVVVHRPQEMVVGVISFAESSRGLAEVERDAAHFVYALDQLERRAARPAAMVVLQAPPSASNEALSSHDRVVKWLADAGVRTIAPSELEAFARNAQHQLSFAR